MTRGLRLLVIGKQGSGKGTLCEQFAQHFSIPHISTGDAFRIAVDQRTAVGLEAKVYLESGRLVPDELVMRVVEERTARLTSSTRTRPSSSTGRYVTSAPSRSS